MPTGAKKTRGLTNKTHGGDSLAALGKAVADELANAPFALLQAPTVAHPPLREHMDPVAAPQQPRRRLHRRLLQAPPPLDRQRLAAQEELPVPPQTTFRQPCLAAPCSAQRTLPGGPQTAHPHQCPNDPISHGDCPNTPPQSALRTLPQRLR